MLHSDIRICQKCNKSKVFSKALSNSLICRDCLPDKDIERAFIEDAAKMIARNFKRKGIKP